VIFISYSRKDKTIVYPLAKLLRATGHETFLDIEDLNYGIDWKLQLATAINKSERFLIFWSVSCKVSEIITEEWRLALAKPDYKIVPVKLDKTPLPKEISAFHGTEDLAFISGLIRKIKAIKRFLFISWTFALILLFSSPFFLLVKSSSALSYNALGSNKEDTSIWVSRDTTSFNQLSSDSSRYHVMKILNKKDTVTGGNYKDTVLLHTFILKAIPSNNLSVQLDSVKQAFVEYTTGESTNVKNQLLPKTFQSFSGILIIGIILFIITIEVHSYRRKQRLYLKAINRLV
jgi:hypothetical protein